VKPILKGIRIVLFILFNLLSFALQGQVTFIIESLPNTTPEEDTIFVTGTFNDWNVNDKRYMLHPQLDGKYSVALELDTSEIEFKFTRGSWQKVETNKLNEYIPNRVYNVRQGKIYRAQIENWQDLGGVKEFNYLVLLLFALAFYGITILGFAIHLQIKFNYFIPHFFPINLIIIVLLIGAVLYNQVNLIWQSHIGMIGIVLLFAWGPVLYFFLNSLGRRSNKKQVTLHFIPSLLVLIVAFLRYFNFKALGFYAKEVNPDISWGSSILIFAGILLNIIYHIAVSRQVKFISDSQSRQKKGERLINLLFLTSSIALIILLFNLVLIFSGIHLWSLIGFELVLIALSAFIFIEFYYYWKYPGIFQLKPDIHYPIFGSWGQSDKKAEFFFAPDKEMQKASQPGLPSDVANELKMKVIEQMEQEKVFKNPTLNIAGLSEIIDTKPHILSKLLNEEFNKSFRDFINEYRIREFIKLASSEKYKNYTLLALSYEVGFNSKSTFNLAFKKEMGVSPSNYLKNNNISLNS